MPEYVTIAGSKVRVSDLPPDVAAAVLAELKPPAPVPKAAPQPAAAPPAEPAAEPPAELRSLDELAAERAAALARFTHLRGAAEPPAASRPLAEELAARELGEDAQPATAGVIPEAATTAFPRAGQDLVWKAGAGRWYHRCCACLRHAGLELPVPHKDHCPYHGDF